jgi:hypothetical protein
MKLLKLLQINGVELTGSFERLSKVLTWICWLECPLEFLPSDFTLDYLVVIDMRYSNIRELWKEKKVQKISKCPKIYLLCNLYLQVTTFDDYFFIIFLIVLTDSQQTKDSLSQLFKKPC